jgi:hypothetical protein
VKRVLREIEHLAGVQAVRARAGEVQQELLLTSGPCHRRDTNWARDHAYLSGNLRLILDISSS